MRKRLKSLVLTMFHYRKIRQSLMAFSSMAALSSYMPAQAALQHDVILQADELDLSVPCVETHLSGDAHLKNGIIIKASHGTAPTMTQAKDGTQNRLALSYGACTHGASLSVVLSPTTTLTIHDSAESHITEEGKLAALEINLQDGILSADTIESLDMSANGTSHINIRQLDRAAQIAATANAEIHIDKVNLTALSATMSNTSTLNINSGLINVVTLFLSNQSKADIRASAEKATVTANEHSLVKIGPLMGALVTKGSGTIKTIKTVSLSDKIEPAPQADAKSAPSPATSISGTAAPVSASPKVTSSIPAEHSAPSGKPASTKETAIASQGQNVPNQSALEHNKQQQGNPSLSVIQPDHTDDTTAKENLKPQP